MKLTSIRAVLGACALGLTLLAGCVLIPGEPTDPPPVDPPPPEDPPPPPDDTWPTDPPSPPDDPPPPVDPPPPPPPPPPPLPPPPSFPPPMSVNVPADSYDIATNRVLVADCRNDALLAVDAATGEVSALIPELPGARPDRYECLSRPVVAPEGGTAYATFEYGIDSSDPDACDGRYLLLDLVSIDTVTGALTTLQNLWTACNCDECSGEYYGSFQFDMVRDRMLYSVGSCTGDWCDSELGAMPLGGGPDERLFRLYPGQCYPDIQDCSETRLIEPGPYTFDPAAADERILMLATLTPAFQPALGSIDIATGETVETIPIPRTWGDLTLRGWFGDLTVDYKSWRVLVTVSATRPDGADAWAVVLIDRYTGTQTLIYDGRPAPDGSKIGCPPDASLDRQANRLLLIEPPHGHGCQGKAFALDLTTGAFTRL